MLSGFPLLSRPFYTFPACGCGFLSEYLIAEVSERASQAVAFGIFTLRCAVLSRTFVALSFAATHVHRCVFTRKKMLATLGCLLWNGYRGVSVCVSVCRRSARVSEY